MYIFKKKAHNGIVNFPVFANTHFGDYFYAKSPVEIGWENATPNELMSAFDASENIPDGITHDDLLDWLDGVSTMYAISPAQNSVRIGKSLDIVVKGSAGETVTLYAFPVDIAPTLEHKLDPVTLDDIGRCVVPFTDRGIGEYAVRGAAGELADVISIIKVVE